MELPNNTVYNILIDSSSKFKGDYYYYCTKGIPVDKMSNAREIHEIGINEQVILLIDTGSFINNGKNSVLFFEEGISISWGSSFEGFEHVFLNWCDIFSIKMIDDKFVFYFDNEQIDNNYPIFINSITGFGEKSERNSKHFFFIVEKIINEYNKYREESINEIDLISTEYQKYFDKQDYSNALELANKAMESYPDSYIGCYLKPHVLNGIGKHDEGLKYINSAIEDFNFLKDGNENDKSLLGSLFVLKAEILKNMEKYFEAILNMNFAYNITVLDEDTITTMDEYYSDYLKHFYEIEYNDRKIVVVAEAFPTMQPKCFIILLNNYFPNIKFPLGHPQTNELYLAHPFRKELYYHYKNFENVLMQEKLMELNDVLECLGAKNIKTKTNEINKSKRVENNSSNLKVGGEYIGGVKGELLSDSNYKNESNSDNKISSEQSFSYNKDPYLPENLLWYHHEPTWQKLAEQRFKGNILKSNIKIHSKDLEFISRSEKNKALAEFKLIILKLNASEENEINMESRIESEVEWEIEVEFHPINKSIHLEEKVSGNILSTGGFNENETEYIELIKDCSEDGIISEDERKILERYKKKYNISDIRSKELEDNIMQEGKLSLNEIEYFEELKFCLQEDNKISTDERRILERLKKKLDIEEERAREIENNLLNK